MPTTLSRSAYRRLLREDLDWLRKQPRSLERDHIIDILEYEQKHLVMKRTASIDTATKPDPDQAGIDVNPISRPCPHGEDPAECQACMVEADFRHDAARENSMFGRLGGRD